MNNTTVAYRITLCANSSVAPIRIRASSKQWSLIFLESAVDTRVYFTLFENRNTYIGRFIIQITKTPIRIRSMSNAKLTTIGRLAGSRNVHYLTVVCVISYVSWHENTNAIFVIHSGNAKRCPRCRHYIHVNVCRLYISPDRLRQLNHVNKKKTRYQRS